MGSHKKTRNYILCYDRSPKEAEGEKYVIIVLEIISSDLDES